MVLMRRWRRQFGDAVVRLDLGGVGLPVQAQRFDEALRERRPVDVGIGDDMRVVVADRAVDLAGQLDRGDLASRWRCRRATTLAISLPSVVGEAVWPWVRDSIGSAGMCVRERAQLLAISASSAGSSTVLARLASASAHS
jgi:hypothetical protein